MDLVSVDITHLKEEPKKLTFIGTEQTINDLSDIANTISHEILINLGNRYTKKYLNWYMNKNKQNFYYLFPTLIGKNNIIFITSIGNITSF